MPVDVFRFEFDQDVPLLEAEMTLQLAILAVGGLYGDARIRLDAGYFLDEPRRVLIVDGATKVGMAVVRVFTGFLLHEIGDESFRVRRVEAQPKERRSA